MSWKFAGIHFAKDYRDDYPGLLQRLKVDFNNSAEGFSLADAIGRDNLAVALGQVNGKTLLFHHFLPHDCSYEPGVTRRLDAILEPISREGDVMNYIIDGISGTYCFSLFSQGIHIRRWAVEPGKVWCDEGAPIAGEKPGDFAGTPIDSPLPAIFAMTADEARIFSVWEAFIGVSFQDLLNQRADLFQFFL